MPRKKMKKKVTELFEPESILDLATIEEKALIEHNQNAWFEAEAEQQRSRIALNEYQSKLQAHQRNIGQDRQAAAKIAMGESPLGEVVGQGIEKNQLLNDKLQLTINGIQERIPVLVEQALLAKGEFVKSYNVMLDDIFTRLAEQYRDHARILSDTIINLNAVSSVHPGTLLPYNFSAKLEISGCEGIPAMNTDTTAFGRKVFYHPVSNKRDVDKATEKLRQDTSEWLGGVPK